MKKMIVFSIITLLLVSSLVIADRLEEDITLNKGWNLVSAELVAFEVMGEGSTYFFYDPINREYFGTGGSKEAEDRFEDAIGSKYGRSGEDYFELASMWVYLDEPTTVSVRDRSSDLSSIEYTLLEGWNFLSIQSSLMGTKLSNVGNCDIVSGYYFNSASQNWEKIGLNENLDFTLGSGILVRVKETCTPDFEATGPVQQPPALPN